MDADPRAEELILEAYRQKNDALREGRTIDRIVMSREHYDAIQRYRARLGEMPEGASDYLERYRLFDLDICVEAGAEIRVE